MHNALKTAIFLAVLILPAAAHPIVENPDSIMEHWGDNKVFPAGPVWSFDTIGKSKIVFEDRDVPKGVCLESNPGSLMKHWGDNKVFPAGPVWSFDTIGEARVAFT